MKARAFRDLARLNDDKLRSTVAKGLDSIAEHVAKLAADAAVLAEATRPRGARILSNLAEEEAGKFLLLLDVVRCPRKPQKRFSTHLGRCSEHLARRIYARACYWRPAKLGDLREYTNGERKSHYLDGPDGGEWIFRNALEREREEDLYVDYVAEEEGHRWASPRDYESVLGPLFPADSVPVRLVGALHDVGIASKKALGVVAEVWQAEDLTDDFGAMEGCELNREVLQKMADRGLLDEKPGAYPLIIGNWQLPMYDLELSRIDVKRADLDEERERRAEWAQGDW